jgi:hypothetical protein
VRNFFTNVLKSNLPMSNVNIRFSQQNIHGMLTTVHKAMGVK